MIAFKPFFLDFVEPHRLPPPFVGTLQDMHYETLYWKMDSPMEPLRAALMIPRKMIDRYVPNMDVVDGLAANRVFSGQLPRDKQGEHKVIKYDARVGECQSTLKRRRSRLRLA